MIDEDLDAFLADHGSPCVCGTVEFLGIVNAPDELLPMGGMHAQSTMTSILVKTSVAVAAAIKYGTPVTVNGVAYTAHNPVQEGDGAFSNVQLSKV